MAVTATTSYGQLQGIDQGRSLAFKGVPYAAPPVGERRFTPPVSPQKWDGVHNATQYAATSLQVKNEALNTLLPDLIPDEPQNEDCLYLNIWTPALDNARRPVLVWIHGGAFTMGSGSPPLYDGTHLTEKGDVVVVTINYRLGVLGFLCLPEGVAGDVRTNFGMLDQVQALKWVQDEIANFGGDPHNITIFGESAGGMSVGGLLASPLAKGLFQRAIPQSGAGHNALSLETVSATAERFAEFTGVNLNDIQALRSLPVATVLEAQRKLEAEMLSAMGQGQSSQMPFQPVNDGHFLTMLPLEAVRRGQAAEVSLLIGTTAEESKLITAMVGGIELSDDALAIAFAGRLTSPEDIATGVQARDTYRKARAARGEGTSNHDLYVAVDTDYMFRIPADRFAEAQAAHQSQVYSYRLDWQSPLRDGLLGACHAIDLPFTFGTQGEPGIVEFAGQRPEAKRLAERMMDAWIAFARSGDPSTTELPWPKFDASKRCTMLLNAECQAVEKPREEERLCWEGKR